MFAMPEQKPPIPLDLSGHRGLPPAEIAPLLEKVGATPENLALSALTALLMNRALRLLRQGSRQEILDESLMLNRFLATPAGDRLKKDRPEVFGGWTALGELLSGAARSVSRTAVPSILSGTRGRDILELLASEGRPLSRAEIKRRLDFKSESHLSHLLRDLEEADLVVRYRPEGRKDVVVELGPVGREVVEQSVLPKWVETFAEVLTRPSVDQRAVVRELLEAGAPSALLANRLAETLAARPAGEVSAGDAGIDSEEAGIVQELREHGGSEYYATLGPRPEDRPLRLFTFKGEQKEAA